MATKKRFLFSIAFFVMGVICVSCKVSRVISTVTPTATPIVMRLPTPEPTITPKVIQGTISLWHSFEEGQRNILFRQIAAFQKEYPQILFDIQYVPMLDLLPAFHEAIQKGSGPGILIAPAEWGPSLYDQGYVLDISPMVEDALIKSLNPAAVQSGMYHDALISLPLDIQGIVLYRNQSIVRVSPVTFDDMVSLAQSATKGETVGAYLERSFFYSGGHFYGLGGQMMDINGKPSFDESNYHFGIAWLDLLKAFERLGPVEYNNDQDIALFQEGRVGLIIDGTWNMQLLAESIGADNLAIDPWPKYQDGHLAGYVQSENIYLTTRAQAENAEISWLFIESMYNEDAQISLADVGLIPAGSGASEFHLTDKVNVSQPLIAQAMSALVDGAPYPIIPEFGVYETPMDILLQSVLYKNGDSQRALQNAYDSIQATLISLHPTLQTTPTIQP
ncbi:MAG: extracellular solute-binding protein [Anaerolineales bacterium]|nr:extracellular solute-binding protein [Anaerolineales bacterium]